MKIPTVRHLDLDQGQVFSICITLIPVLQTDHQCHGLHSTDFVSKFLFFLKQSIMVVSCSVNHGYLSIIMPPSMFMFGNSLLVLIALILLQIALAQYLALNNRITP